MPPKKTASTGTIDDAASEWLSRRDRGLTAAEQDAYLDWLYRDPLHGRAIMQLERVWGALNRLDQWRPAHSAVPNPDLLAPRLRPRFAWLATMLATAAALTVALYLWLPARPAPAAARTAIIHPGPERLELEDGSVVELNTGARVDVNFTPGTRAVRLLRGEAHFTVAKNPARPFIVSAGAVAVRAVGTAFSMSLGAQELSVLVTEGKVQVDEPGAGRGAPGEEGPLPVAPRPAPAPLLLTAGQRTVIGLAEPAGTLRVQDVTPAEIERALAWQGMRLEFEDLPLGDVVAEFNRYNRTKLSVADAGTAALLVGGNFRADNIEGFVRLLESTFGIRAFRHGNEIILRPAQ